MKRMQIAAAACQNRPYQSLDRDVEPWAMGDDADAPHCLFVPLHYEKKYAYPLLVWLHSRGDNERQLRRIMPQVSLRNYVAIGPRGTSPDADATGPAYRWRQTEAGIVEAQWRLMRSIDLVRARYNIHDARVFVGGFADGGAMALRLALRMPQVCAGVFSIGGGLSRVHAPLINIENARGMPILLMHGCDSMDYPSSRVCDDLRLLHAAGMALSIRQYPAADELTTEMLSDVDAWMMEHVTGIPSQTDEPAFGLGERN